jgi:tetratricopeptide (TPR) repeat protein
MNVGTLLLYFGFLTGSRQCFSQAAKLIPNDHRPIVNLAKIARDAGNYAESRRLYSHLLQHFPDNPVIRRMSAHREFLEQYADIDIALDPFPGYSTAEAAENLHAQSYERFHADGCERFYQLPGICPAALCVFCPLHGPHRRHQPDR